MNPMPHAPARLRVRGFTLIELMIVVAIIAILASIAIPSYRDYILRGRMADATSALAVQQAQMERYYQDNRTYAPVNSGAIQPPCSAGDDADRKAGDYFLIRCDGEPTGTAFTVQVIGSGPVNGFTFKIDQTGTRSTISPTNWAGNCANSWLLKRGQACND